MHKDAAENKCVLLLLPNAHRNHPNTDAQKYRENTPRGIEMRAHSINEGNWKSMWPSLSD